MLLLGLGGKPHSGKTVAAEFLRRVYKAKIYSISDMICDELGLKRKDIKDPRILQDHGQKRRQQDPDYWVGRIGARISAERPEIAVIPNIRMASEVAMVREFRGHLVRYTRLNPDGSQHIHADRDMNHPLETSLDLFNWDFHITAKCGQKRLVELQTLAVILYFSRKEMPS